MAERPDIQYYDEREKTLKYDQIHKAKELVKRKCIRYDPGFEKFVCDPIWGYNKTQYRFDICSENLWGWECSCQGWQTKAKQRGKDYAGCSHVLALVYYLVIEHHSRAVIDDPEYIHRKLKQHGVV